MKLIGIFYATREGQTQRIAEYVASGLRRHGFEVQVRNVRKALPDIEWSRYATAVIAASVHGGKHEREMVYFIKKYRSQLDQLPTTLLSVTLSEAGVERPTATAAERARFTADVEGMLRRFYQETGWHPLWVKPVAGALLYTKYNPLVRFVMKRIARSAGAGTDTSRDYEYTNWAALDAFIKEFADEIAHATIS